MSSRILLPPSERTNEFTLHAAGNVAEHLINNRNVGEARRFIKPRITLCEGAFGPNGEELLKMRYRYATTLFDDPARSVDDLTEALLILEDIAPRFRRVFGISHPLSGKAQGALRMIQSALARARAAQET